MDMLVMSMIVFVTLLMGVYVFMISFMDMGMFVVMLVFVNFLMSVIVSQAKAMGMGMALSMLVPMWSTANPIPRKKKKPGKNQYRAHNMSLLSINLLLKLQTDQSNNPAQHERGQHMAQRGQKRNASHAQQAPALRPRHNCQRNPVVRQDGMKDGNHTSGANQ